MLSRMLAKAGLVELAPPASRTAALDGTAVDISTYEGSVLAILSSAAASAGTNPTLDVKLQHADTEAGAYTDVDDGAFTQVTDAADVVLGVAVDVAKLKPWVKAVGTLGGTNNPAFTYAVVLAVIPKYDG